jgi:hypothetical protein
MPGRAKTTQQDHATRVTRLGEYSLSGNCLPRYFLMIKVPPISAFFYVKIYALIWTKIGFGYILGDFSHKLIWFLCMVCMYTATYICSLFCVKRFPIRHVFSCSPYTYVHMYINFQLESDISFN